MKNKILIVDDEREIADLIQVYLKNEGFDVLKFYSAIEGMKCIEEEKIDLAILDLMLPDGDGFSMCQKIREKHRFPIIMLTAKEEEIDKITGFTLGADDYITKPFKPLELVARVKAQLRRYKKYNNIDIDKKDDQLLLHKGLRVDIKTYEVILDEKIMNFTPTEFQILRILLMNKGNVVSAEEIFNEIWKEEYFNKTNNTIPTHIRHIREKMNDSIERPKYIKTVWGVGYKIEK